MARSYRPEVRQFARPDLDVRVDISKKKSAPAANAGEKIEVRCPHCGVLEIKTAFCSECGGSLENAQNIQTMPVVKY